VVKESVRSYLKTKSSLTLEQNTQKVNATEMEQRDVDGNQRCMRQKHPLLIDKQPTILKPSKDASCIPIYRSIVTTDAFDPLPI
jgi:hypothetical protein